MWLQPLGWGEPLEEEMGTHSSILAWEIPWTEEPGESWLMELKEVDMTERLSIQLLDLSKCIFVYVTYVHSTLEQGYTNIIQK